MKTEPSKYYRWGTILIWVGVLVWAPFILLKLTGGTPSFLGYLPFHLLGVIGGARLRAFARKEMGLPAPKRNPLRIAGGILIALGILVWAPYFYLKMSAQTAVEVMNFLPFHLTGVLGGVSLLAIDQWKARKKHSE
jgi:hypothetical protein